MVVFETINFSEAKRRKSELSNIAEEVYSIFEQKYSASKATNKNNIFKVNSELKATLHDAQSSGTHEIVVESDDLVKHKIEDKQVTEDPNKMFNNPFENVEEEKQFDANFLDNNDSFNEEFVNDPAFKSFDQFVKFVKVEERLWERENDSICKDSISY